MRSNRPILVVVSIPTLARNRQYEDNGIHCYIYCGEPLFPKMLPPGPTVVDTRRHNASSAILVIRIVPPLAFRPVGDAATVRNGPTKNSKLMHCHEQLQKHGQSSASIPSATRARAAKSLTFFFLEATNFGLVQEDALAQFFRRLPITHGAKVQDLLMTLACRKKH